MKKYIPFNNIVLCEKLETTTASSSVVVMPTKDSRFIRVKVLATGGSVNPLIKINSICLANNLFEVINPSNPDIGFINEKDILAREEEIRAHS